MRSADWTELAMPRFATMSAKGAVTALFCKACGTQIASHDGKHLVYSSEYIEAKLRCADNSFHVTNGCDTCLTLAMTQSQMQQLMTADAAFDLGIANRVPVEVVELGRGKP